MCNYSSYVMNKGIQKGMQQGMLKGAEQNELKNIRSLMQNTGWDAKQAMNNLNIPSEQQQKYAQLLKQ